MRWFALFVPRERGGGRVRPAMARTLWDRDRPLWLIGEWPETEVRLARAGDRRVAVLGPCAMPDDDLMAVVTHGRLPPEPWPGTYTLICQEAERNEIHTDLAWASPVYLTSRAEGTYIASSLLPLASLVGGQLDRSWLTTRLLCPGLPHLLEGRSPFEGVMILPPGARTTITARGVYATRTWMPTRRAFAEGASRLREALVGGVRARASSARTVTTDLSGGLDSSSVTFLAAHTAGPGARLIASTLVPDGVRHGGDVDHARRVAAVLPAVRHGLVPIDQYCLPFTDVTAVPPTDEPAASTAALARVRRHLRLLARLGSTCHLTGDGGDAVLTAPLTYLVDLARVGRMRLLLAHTAGWAQLLNLSPLGLFLGTVREARCNRANVGIAVANSLRQGFPSAKPQPTAHQTPIQWLLATASGSTPPWWTADARRLAVGLATAAEVVVDAGQAPADRAALNAIRTMGRLGRSEIQLADHYGVPLHNPFLDAAVADACMSVPAEQRTSPMVAKPLLCVALSGDVPSFVFARRTKGDFTVDDYLGIRRNVDELHALFTSSRLAELGLLDDASVRTVIDQAAAGLAIDLPAFDIVVAAEAWLAALSRRWDDYWITEEAVAA